MKKKLISLFITLILFIPLTTILSFANTQTIIDRDTFLGPSEVSDNSNVVNNRSIRTYSLSFARASNTKGTGKLTVFSSTTPSSIKATIRLQVSASGSTSYQNSSVDPITTTVQNKSTLSKSFSFPISTSKKYRVKATVVEIVNGNKSTYTYYKNLT